MFHSSASIKVGQFNPKQIKMALTRVILSDFEPYQMLLGTVDKASFKAGLKGFNGYALHYMVTFNARGLFEQALQQASTVTTQESLNLFLCQTKDDGKNILHVAAMYCDWPVFCRIQEIFLTRLGAEKTYQLLTDKVYSTPLGTMNILHLAALNAQTDSFIYLSQRLRQQDAAQWRDMLYEVDRLGTPLHYAAVNNQDMFVMILEDLKRFSNIDLKYLVALQGRGIKKDILSLAFIWAPLDQYLSYLEKTLELPESTENYYQYLTRLPSGCRHDKAYRKLFDVFEHMSCVFPSAVVLPILTTALEKDLKGLMDGDYTITERYHQAVRKSVRDLIRRYQDKESGGMKSSVGGFWSQSLGGLSGLVDSLVAKVQAPPPPVKTTGARIVRSKSKQKPPLKPQPSADLPWSFRPDHFMEALCATDTSVAQSSEPAPPVTPSDITPDKQANLFKTSDAHAQPSTVYLTFQRRIHRLTEGKEQLPDFPEPTTDEGFVFHPS